MASTYNSRTWSWARWGWGRRILNTRLDQCISTAFQTKLAPQWFVSLTAIEPETESYFIFHFISIFTLFYVNGCCVCVYACVPHLCSVPRSHERATDTVVLLLTMHHNVGAGNQTRVTGWSRQWSHQLNHLSSTHDSVLTGLFSSGSTLRSSIVMMAYLVYPIHELKVSLSKPPQIPMASRTFSDLFILSCMF